MALWGLLDNEASKPKFLNTTEKKLTHTVQIPLKLVLTQVLNQKDGYKEQ